MKTALVVYVPVPHLGYIELIKRHQLADLVLLPLEVIQMIDPIVGGQLGRDMQLRGIPISLVKKTFDGEFGVSISILDSLESLRQYQELIMPDEDISHSIKEKATWATVKFDSWFQRWDWNNTNIPKEVVDDYEISTDEFDRHFIGIAEDEAQKSSDFWRQVGAVVALEKGILTAFNEHLPTSAEPYINGDMRGSMRPGEKPEVCNALHGEKGIFAKALLEGISMKGKKMYVSTFPCLPCAQMIARAGITQLFFKEGYSNQNAQEVLRSKGVKIIRVQ